MVVNRDITPYSPSSLPSITQVFSFSRVCTFVFLLEVFILRLSVVLCLLASPKQYSRVIRALSHNWPVRYCK